MSAPWLVPASSLLLSDSESLPVHVYLVLSSCMGVYVRRNVLLDEGGRVEVYFGCSSILAKEWDLRLPWDAKASERVPVLLKCSSPHNNGLSDYLEQQSCFCYMTVT